ncbi:NAD(P)/FAD-dependent oxidoreductase [Paenibacillus sp. GCM10027626]|uniref:NAD(P)/FAD-dependent oxidoreductase n=1 Tax=Paenibacillus sp. GCM10027626 TaxID=3273411 RepID=UPI00363675BA
MKPLNCVVVGGGFAGIHALKAIRKAYKEEDRRGKLQLTLIDRESSHTRKVLFFRPAVSEEAITVPWEHYLPEDARFVQGTALYLTSDDKQLIYIDQNGVEQRMHYDILVVAIGSVVREQGDGQGGIALTGAAAAVQIRQQWQRNLQLAAKETNEIEKQRLMAAAVAGAGITGVETAAELAFAMRTEAARLGLSQDDVQVHLLNSQPRLFMEAPPKVSHRLEQELQSIGVTAHHRTKVLREDGGQLELTSSTSIPVGLTVWTLGLVPNPGLGKLGLPLSPDGRIIVDESYRVKGAHGVYAIGDCALVIERESGKVDRMTCKEAVPQAQRLGKIIWADLTGSDAPRHRRVLESFTIGLGPGRGLLWTRKWGLNIIISGKLAYRIKVFLWEYSSMLNK